MLFLARFTFLNPKAPTIIYFYGPVQAFICVDKNCGAPLLIGALSENVSLAEVPQHGHHQLKQSYSNLSIF
jgi:hypothetical protein